MLFFFRSAPEVEKRIHSKLFRKFWRSRGTKEPAYITVLLKQGFFYKLQMQKYAEAWLNIGSTESFWAELSADEE